MTFFNRSTIELAYDNKFEEAMDIARLYDALDYSVLAAHCFFNTQKHFVDLAERLMMTQKMAMKEAFLSTLPRFDNHAVIAWMLRCLTMVIHRDDQSVTSWQMDFLNISVTDLRAVILKTIERMPDAVTPLMRTMLSDPNAAIRLFAITLLKSLRHPDCETWLIDIIETDPDVFVCAEAVDLLDEIATQAAIGPLFRVKDRFLNEPYIQLAADFALKDIHNSRCA